MESPSIETSDTSSSKRDGRNIVVLLILYTLQGVPYGFAMALPIIVQNIRYTSYRDQAKLSLVLWPFIMKLLWAPIVDSLFIRKFGRRKSWLIPIQYSLGGFFFLAGYRINDWLVNNSKPQIYALTCTFFILNFLAATQDIVVDGWALTMLKRENINYASTCNAAGQSIGIFFGYILPITLISESFCNRWLRTSPLAGGMIVLKNYLYFWGAVFMVVTTLVAIFKSEKNCPTNTDSVNIGIIKTYKLIFKIMRLTTVKTLAIILLSISISFSPVDAAFKLKLIDGGINKEEIGAIELFFVILKIFLPLGFFKCISKTRPMKNYLTFMIYRLIICGFIAVIIYLTPYFILQSQNVGLFYTYKIILVLVYILHESIIFIMSFTAVAFFANISDPRVGGTNMTLLNTIKNFGELGSKTGALWLIDVLTIKRCSINNRDVATYCKDNYYHHINAKICDHLYDGSSCKLIFDGFYIEVLVCTIYGIIWYHVFRNTLNILQTKSVEEWHVEVIK